jgi:hypothetical protein
VEERARGSICGGSSGGTRQWLDVRRIQPVGARMWPRGFDLRSPATDTTMRRRGTPRSGGSSFPDADPATTDADLEKRRPTAPGSGDGGSLRPCSCVRHGEARSGYWAENGLASWLGNGLAGGLMDFFSDQLTEADVLRCPPP